MTAIRFWGGAALLGFLIFSSAAARGQAPPLEEILAKVQELYDSHEDFQAYFVQESLVRSLGRKQVSEGMVYFKKPGKMHWDYQKPLRQQVISDGKTLWNFRPEEKQVVVSGMSPDVQGKMPSTFLAGLGNLRRDFRAKWAREASSSEPYSLELTPQEVQGSLEKLFLVVDRGSYRIHQARVQDLMGNTTQVSFSKIRFNNRLPDSLFTFSAPAGVEVFNLPGAAPAGKGGR